jgi:predicted DNA-binding transcriptional regulator AlpA
MLTIKQTVATLGVATSTIHRSTTGIIAGEQLAPAGVSAHAHRLGLSRQTVWQRVKRTRAKPSRSSADARKACASSSIALNPTSATKPQK